MIVQKLMRKSIYFGSTLFIFKALFLATLLLFSISIGDARAQNLFVTSVDTNEVIRYNGQTGAFIDIFVSSMSGGLDSPGGIAFGPDGNLYVSSRNTDEILRYDGVTGAFIDIFVSSMSGGLNGPSGIVFGQDNNLYVSSNGSSEVLR